MSDYLYLIYLITVCLSMSYQDLYLTLWYECHIILSGYIYDRPDYIYDRPDCIYDGSDCIYVGSDYIFDESDYIYDRSDYMNGNFRIPKRR